MVVPVVAAAGRAAVGAAQVGGRAAAGAARVGGRAAVGAARAGGRALASGGRTAANGGRRVGNKATNRPGGSSRPRGRPRRSSTRPDRKRLGLNPLKKQGQARGRRGRADQRRLPGQKTLRRLRPRRGKDEQQDDAEQADRRSRPGRLVGGGSDAPGPAGTDGAGATDPAQHAERALRSISRAPGRILRMGRRKRRHRARRRVLVILTALMALFFGLPILGVVSDGWASSGSPESSSYGLPLDSQTLVEASRRTGIPTCEPNREPGCVPALEAYISAAGRAWNVPNGEGTHNVDWALLAAIGKKECDHGRGNCERPSANECGARGPMQFLGNTWRSGTDPVTSGECPGASHFTGDPVGPPVPEGRENRGYATDGDSDEKADPWSFHDATHAAARYLVRNGVKDDQRRAILAYNNSDDYASDVLRIAGDYRRAVEDLVVEPNTNVAGGPCPVQPQGSTARVEDQRSTDATLAMANAIVSCFGRGGHSIGCYSPRPPRALYEHPRGRACDFMITSGGMPSSAEQDRGQAMAEWVAANAASLNVLYVIWYDRSWNPSDGNRPWSEWRDYSGCQGDPSSCHYNHVHVSVKLMPGDPSSARCTHSQCSE